MDFSVNGDFGEVRMKRNTLNNYIYNAIDHYSIVGWHKCNDRYGFKTPFAIENHFLLFTVKSGGQAVAQNQLINLTSNTLLIVPAGTKMTYYTAKDSMWEFYWLQINGTNATEIINHIISQNGYLLSLSNLDKIRDNLESIIHNKSKSFYHQIEDAKLLAKILFLILENTLDLLPHKEQKFINDVMEFIDDHYQEDIKVKEIAKNFFISPEHLIRVFLKETGSTPYKYLVEYRLNKGCDLLRFTEEPIKNITQLVGYKSEGGFIKAFEKHFFMSPSTYRNKYR